MKPTIIAKDREHLIKIIKSEMRSNGYACDLNHIDVSKITDMSGVFSSSKFNGNISQWNTSKVITMSAMFLGSSFTGNINNWNVSNVKKMDSMFYDSKFNNDVSKWDVSNVVEMYAIFASSNFNGDLSSWMPYSLKDIRMTYLNQLPNVPYWATIEDKDARNNAINNYWLGNELEKNLSIHNSISKKIKI